jgi:hypothetical protein
MFDIVNEPTTKSASRIADRNVGSSGCPPTVSSKPVADIGARLDINAILVTSPTRYASNKDIQMHTNFVFSSWIS